MYRVKSHLWPVCCVFLKMWCLGHQVLLHVWAKIAPRTRFSPLLHNLYFSPQKSMNASAIFAKPAHLSLPAPLLHDPPAKINECFGSNHTSGRLGAFNLFGGVRPSNNCVLVSKRHVFYQFFEATLGLREKHVLYDPFEALRGLREWCQPARGTILAETLVVFSSRKRGRSLFLRPTEVLFLS